MSYVYVENTMWFGEFQEDLDRSELLEVDTEATGTNYLTDTWTLLQVRAKDRIYIFDVQKLGMRIMTYVVSLIKDSGKVCLFHNAKFDIKVIRHNTGELLTSVYDTMLVELIITAGLWTKWSSLEELVEKYTDHKLDKTVREEFYGNTVITERMLVYAAEDVLYMEEIRAKQMAKVKEHKLEKIVKLEMDLVPVIIDMEYEGIILDVDHWRNLDKLAQEKAKRMRDEFLELLMSKLDISKYANAAEVADAFYIPVDTKKLRVMLEGITEFSFVTEWFKDNINLGSPKQMLNILKNYFGVPLKKGTGEDELKPFKKDFEVIDKLLDYRGFVKQISTYGEKFLEDVNPITGKIHTEYNQLGAYTGRFSSDSPNLQNIPADHDDTTEEESYRVAFVADEGYELVTADYSQAELRLLGAVANEPEFIRAYQHKEDIHKLTATKIFGVPLEEVTKDQRRKGKTLNFGIVYGISVWGLYYKFSIPMEQGEQFLADYFKGYVYITEFIKNAGNLIWKLKYSVTPMGRKRFFEDKKIYKDAKEAFSYEARVKREGVNHIIQGGSADIVKLALINIWYNNPFGDKLKILLQVHDEIVCKVSKDILDPAMDFIRKCMLDAEQPFLKEIPAEVDISHARYWSK